MADDARKATGGQSGTQPVSGCLVRLGWIAGGNVLLLIVTVLILQERQWTLTAKDLAFWAVVAIVIILRYVDIRRFHGTTMEGEPATLRHFARYMMGVLGVSTILWILAQSLHFQV